MREYAIGENQMLGVLFMKRTESMYIATIDASYFQIEGYGETSEFALRDALLSYDEHMARLKDEMI